MKIGIYGQFYHKDSEIYIQYILDALQNKNVEIVVEEAFLKSINKNKDISKNYSKIFSFKEIDASYNFFLLTAISFKAKFNGEIFSFFGLVEIESKLLSEIK